MTNRHLTESDKGNNYSFKYLPRHQPGSSPMTKAARGSLTVGSSRISFPPLFDPMVSRYGEVVNGRAYGFSRVQTWFKV